MSNPVLWEHIVHLSAQCLYAHQEYNTPKEGEENRYVQHNSEMSLSNT